MDGISKKLIKDGIHSTIRVNFSLIGEFLATTLPSSAADEVSGAADDEQWMPSFISFFEMPSIMNLASQ